MVFLDLAYLILLIISLPVYVKVFLKKEYRAQIKGRFSPDVNTSQKKRIWLHAVSVGEVKSLAGFVSELKKSFNGEIVLSVTTPSGLKVAKKEFPGLTVINAPFDFSFTIKSFLKKINPGVIILNELELWPNWIIVSKRSGVPVILINGRISENAFAKYKRFSFLLKPFFRKLERVMIQGDIYREKFLELGVDPEKIKICGNIKADEALKGIKGIPGNPEIYRYLKAEDPGCKVNLLASSHPEDERFFLPLIKTLRKDYSIIIAPRHINRTDEIGISLEGEGVKFSVWSRESTIDLENEVMVFDKMGYLLNLMQIAEIVFMGGSFNQKTGGHNLYEPAALGKKIVGGPYYNNFPDIGSALIKSGAYSIVNEPGDFFPFLKNLNNKNIINAGKSGKEAVLERRGAIRCSINEIEKYLS